MKQCIISFEDKDIVDKMQELGFICHNTISSDCVSDTISTHSDILYLKTEDKHVIISHCQKANLSILEKAGYSVDINHDLKPGYKTESYLNFIINKEYAISNPKTALNLNLSQKRINVKQGYTKCSVLCVNESAYITADNGIHKILLDNNLDCLLLENTHINLTGYEYGFIGGASAKISEREILFFGDIPNMEEKKKVVEFLNKYSVKAIFIENKMLNDIGSAFIV